MKHRIAFGGFRHPHILALWKLVKGHQSCEVVGTFEADAAAQVQLGANEGISISHKSLDHLLCDSQCDILAIGGVFARRGSIAIRALSFGVHVISDAQVTTSLSELDEIDALCHNRNLVLGCQLDLVENKAVRRLKASIHVGDIGWVCTINISAQHPLRLSTKASWYFEPSLHGGTRNDIGVHVIDLLPWLTGFNLAEIIAAREWNAKAGKAKHFTDCVQIFASLESGATCFADLSYLELDRLRYDTDHYWRITVQGTKDLLETNYKVSLIAITADSDGASKFLPMFEDSAKTCLDDFLDEISGSPFGRTLYAPDSNLLTRRSSGAEVGCFPSHTRDDRESSLPIDSPCPFIAS